MPNNNVEISEFFVEFFVAQRLILGIFVTNFNIVSEFHNESFDACLSEILIVIEATCFEIAKFIEIWFPILSTENWGFLLEFRVE